jgi:hypothetical protein
MNTVAEMASSLSDDLRVRPLTPEEMGELANLFAVEPDDVRPIVHPFGSAFEAVSIHFARGGNVPVALASYLNHEFYAPPQKADLTHLHYSPNPFAYVAEIDVGEVLVLTISEPPERFLKRLAEKASELRYVSLHPEILFMIRPNGSYQKAKAELQNGVRPVL